MARDAVFNAASVMRAVAGSIPSDFDLHVNVVGGGNIDGPSAGLAFFPRALQRAHERRCRRTSR
jgi:ATP-dependent Lon protease